MNVNLIYDNSGPRTPTGATANQPLASFNNIGVRSYRTTNYQQTAPATNVAAKSVIQSNGEMIGNAQLPSNPLPPGITQ
jgi:hypothetical protein